MRKTAKNNLKNILKVSVVALFIISVSTILVNENNNLKSLSKLDTTAVEITYKANSPAGEFGGTILPASCESGAWNSNNGYHQDGVNSDPGNCTVPVIPVNPSATTTPPIVNDPPLTPVISGDQWAILNQTTSNWIVSTDPDGDDIFYELDWDCDGDIDGTTSSRQSAQNTPIGHTYTTVGTKSVCGYAVQTNDTTKRSGQGRYTIRVTNGTCTAPANACGVTNGTVVNGNCAAPGLPAGYGNSCSGGANICGMRNNNGTIGCSGSCIGATTPSNTLCSCTSAANSCGMTTSGFYNAAGTACTATAPSEASCAAPVVGEPGVTINSFTASPKLVNVGKTSKLYWDVTGNISSCNITYTTIASQTPVQVENSLGSNTGNKITTPVTEKRYYKLKCGSQEREAVVSVFSLTEI